MTGEKVINTNEDPVKRGKLITLSLLIALSLFILTLLKINNGDIIGSVLTSLGYFVLSIIGLIWAFNFQVSSNLFHFLFNQLFL
jgi:hypothetical protein